MLRPLAYQVGSEVSVNDLAIQRRQEVRSMLAPNLRKFKEQAKREGRGEGERVGLQKGRAEGLRTIARNMEQEGYSATEIARLTGLSLGQIENL